MEGVLFESKFEIPFNSEKSIVKVLGITLIEKYNDMDNYLRHGDKNSVLKIKSYKRKIILSRVIFRNGLFRITQKVLTKDAQKKLLEKNPISVKINRKKRVYKYGRFNTSIDFDYMKQLPHRLFLEIHSNKESDVLKAKRYVVKHVISGRVITKAYNKLLPNRFWREIPKHRQSAL